MTNKSEPRPQDNGLEEEFEIKALPLIHGLAAKNIHGQYVSARVQPFWGGWLAARTLHPFPPSHFNLLPATTLLEFKGMKVCSNDVGEPGYTYSQLETFYGCNGARPDLLHIFEKAVPAALLEFAGAVAANVLLDLPPALCFVRPAATLPGYGGMQVWKDDGTAEPAITLSALRKALIPGNGASPYSEGAATSASVADAIAAEIEEMRNQGIHSVSDICTNHSSFFARCLAIRLGRGIAPSARVLSEARFRLYDEGGRMQLLWDWTLLTLMLGITDCPPYSQTVLNRVNFNGYSWVEVDGLHYDAETPQGVRNFFELPYMQRQIEAQRNKLPYQKTS